MTERKKTDKSIEQDPFEYILKINGHVICQRFFNIYNFNPDVIDSLEMKELLDDIAGMNNGDWGTMGIIPNFLKDKTSAYLHHFHEDTSGYLKEQGRDKDILVPNIWKPKTDVYTFEIKIDGETVGITEFTGNFFPPKVRYNVNLKQKTNYWGDRELDDNKKSIPLGILSKITKEIKNVFQQKSYTHDLMGYDLDYNTKLREEYAKKYLTLSN